MTYTILNLLYHAILLALLVILGWNTMRLGDPRKQVMIVFIMLRSARRFPTSSRR